MIYISHSLQYSGPSKLQSSKIWKALHFVMRVIYIKKNIKKRNEKRLAYTSLVCPNLEYGAACWDPSREGQINALDRVTKKVDQFKNHTKDSEWETLAQLRMIAHLCAVFNPLQTKRRLLYLKTQSVPRCKHFSSKL
jgi:hypothetical protein